MSKRKRKNKTHRDYRKRSSMRYRLDDDLFLFFPPLTKEQQSVRQKENASHNLHNYKILGVAVASKKQHSAWTKKQWRENKKYREMMLANCQEWANKAKYSIGKTPKSIAYLERQRQSSDRPAGMIEHERKRVEVNRLMKKYGIDGIETNKLKLPELNKIYYSLKTLE